ncbi:hypothetical protein GGU10DRAFT_177304 [Lentinula aff. detonsa]|uniref:Uncharacterized protein n=1 Tax=Lentinula aff. detonsa TaxID=2804958 RepID=A0AA38NMC3_9AGAR|nr:hypothetical protein GGU10DRAFT_177304 [Lentinula aff. detonsa]
MEYSSVFLKARAIIFSLISLISFIWVVVICVDLFIQWGVLSISERAFLVVMLLSNTLTLIMLLVLLILPFRPWLDGARLMLLLVMHIGIASGFALWNAKFTCPTKTVDEEGVCRLLNMYILIANWIIPATLLVYALGLAVMLYKRRKLKAVLPDLESSRSRQPESRQFILPMMVPADIRFPSVSTTPHTSVISQQLRESVWGAGASSSPPQSIVEGKRGSSSGRSRLSKPLPGSMYY